MCELMKYRFTYNSETFLSSREPVSISGRTVLHGVGELVMYFVEQIVM